MQQTEQNLTGSQVGKGTEERRRLISLLECCTEMTGSPNPELGYTGSSAREAPGRTKPSSTASKEPQGTTPTLTLKQEGFGCAKGGMAAGRRV